LLVLGARWFVGGSVEVARLLGVSELVVGLTIVAAGTSMPEVATSIVATVRGQRDIAIGNVVGSNLYNILAILGVSGLLARDGVPVPPAALRFDLWVMLAVAFGLSMPALIAGDASAASGGVGGLSWGSVLLHTVAITVLANLGKMFPLFCYGAEADLRTRLALCIGMWPRGEVGAGVLVVSLSYGVSPALVTVAMLALALNLACTGFFILAVKRLLGPSR
jgi:Ca2+/Na+ antiporter